MTGSALSFYLRQAIELTSLPVQTKLSKMLIPDAGKLAWRTRESFEAAGVDFQLNKEVESVDFAGHKLKTKDGEEYAYDKVLFATVSFVRIGYRITL